MRPHGYRARAVGKGAETKGPTTGGRHGRAQELYGVVIGAVAGAVVGLISHTMAKGTRDFSSVGALEADHLEVLAEPGDAEQARHLLSQL